MLLYEDKGFEVLLVHRLFNPKEKYEPKLLNKDKEDDEEKKIALPKKTEEFLKFWGADSDNIQSYKLF